MTAFSCLLFASFIANAFSSNYCNYFVEPGSNGTEESFVYVIPGNTYTFDFCNAYGLYYIMSGMDEYKLSYMYTCTDDGDGAQLDVYLGTFDCDNDESNMTISYDDEDRDFMCGAEMEDCTLSYNNYFNNAENNTDCDMSDQTTYQTLGLLNGACTLLNFGDDDDSDTDTETDDDSGESPDFYIGVNCDPDVQGNFKMGLYIDDECMWPYLKFNIWDEQCPAIFADDGDEYGWSGYANITCEGRETTSMPESTVIVDDACSYFSFYDTVVVPMATNGSSDYCLSLDANESMNFFCSGGYPYIQQYAGSDCDQEQTTQLLNYGWMSLGYFGEITDDHWSCQGSGDNCNVKTVYLKDYHTDNMTDDECTDTLMGEDSEEKASMIFIVAFDVCANGVIWECNDDDESEEEDSDSDSDIIGANWNFRFTRYVDSECTGDNYTTNEFPGDSDSDTDTDTDSDMFTSTMMYDCMGECTCGYADGCAPTMEPTETPGESPEDPEAASTVHIRYAIALVMLISVFFV
eukprot:375146_1